MNYERLYKHIMGVLQDWITDPTEGFNDVQIDSFQKVFDLMFEKMDADPRYLVGYNSSLTASEMGKLGGSSKTEAKSSASRENGKKGGRPKKKDLSHLDHVCEGDPPF